VDQLDSTCTQPHLDVADGSLELVANIHVRLEQVRHELREVRGKQNRRLAVFAGFLLQILEVTPELPSL
jgi:hypothetical protein